MKKLIFFATSILSLNCFAQGFGTSATNWPAPVGGTINGGVNWGYWLSASEVASSFDITSRNWSLMDISGDNKPDLVITSEKMGNGTVTDYSPTSNPYWKVYLNTGTAFSTTANNWAIPVGGTISGGNNWGYWLPTSVVASSFDVSSKNWTVMDMNADNKPDLLITSEKMGNGTVTDYSPTSNPYWKVYLNTGSAFSTTANNWPVPVGGTISSGVNWGYWLTSSEVASSFDVTSKNWSVMDIDGDNKSDLVISSEKMSNGDVTDYSPTSNPYWKIYKGTGSAFSSTVTNWTAPVGGTINGGINWGYWLPTSVVASSFDITSKNWLVMDINGDNKSDLVVTSEKMGNGTVTDYSPTSNPYWKVYLNGGSSSITEQNQSIDCSVYPNPFSSSVNIVMGEQQKSKIDIFNVLGEELYSSVSTELQTEIDLSKLESGIYIITISCERGIVTKKLIKP